MHQVRKTIVIGLGGTGRDAVLHMKRKYREVYGTDDVPTTRFLVLDTTAPDTLQSVDGQEVRLQPGEFAHMTVSNPKGVVQQNSEVRGWFPEEGVPLSAINSGAGQVRALGRLALFANAHEIYPRIRQVFTEVNAIKPQEDLGQFELIGDEQGETPVLVNIVGSLSGGTGAGTFLDVAFLCREHIRSQDTLIGYLLLPGVFVDKPATQNVRPNAYGAIKELDMLMDRSSASLGDRFTFGGYEVKRGEAPFDIVYLVNNTNTNGVVLTEVAELTELFGIGLFVSSGAIGKGTSDVWDNLKRQITSTGSFDGKNALYSSFGVSEILLDTDGFSRQLAHNIALHALQNTFIGLQETGIDERVESFIEANRLCEHDADHIIDDLLPPGAFVQFRATDGVSKRSIDNEFQRADAHVQRVEGDVTARVGQRRVSLQQEKLASIDAFIADQLRDPRGLPFARKFLRSLRAKLTEYREEMIQERDDIREKHSRIEGRRRSLREEADKAKSKLFGAKGILEDVAKNLASFVNDRSRLRAEVLRRDEAASLYTAILSHVQREEEKLNDLASRIENLRENLTSRLERLRSQKNGLRPFTIEISPPREALQVGDSANGADFLTWLRDQNLDVRDLADLQADALEQKVLQFGWSRERVEQVNDLHIEDVLEGMSPDEFRKVVNQLDRLAAPNWRYERAFLAGRRRTETIYLFGVDNAQETMFEPANLGEILSSTHPPAIASTADRHRVFCYKVEAAIPAFIMEGMSMYKNFYEDRDAPFSYHIDKAWEKMTPDLWPTGDDESRSVWSLAQAPVFGLIKRRGAHYYVRSEYAGDVMDDYEVKLDQGRANALDAFSARPQVVSELKSLIEQRTRTMGAETVATQLKSYIEDLRQMPVADDSVKRLIGEEIGDIREAIRELTVTH
ncbi:MAG: tubulin-like doman-containing protein [Bacteroidota bacterium]